jgi:hypothetical protein
MRFVTMLRDRLPGLLLLGTSGVWEGDDAVRRASGHGEAPEGLPAGGFRSPSRTIRVEPIRAPRRPPAPPPPARKTEKTREKVRS